MTTTNPQVALNAHLLVGDASYRAAGIAVYITNLLRHVAAVDNETRYRVLLGRDALFDPVKDLAMVRSRIDTRRPQVRIVGAIGDACAPASDGRRLASFPGLC
jgi:hypothetical protein